MKKKNYSKASKTWRSGFFAGLFAAKKKSRSGIKRKKRRDTTFKRTNRLRQQEKFYDTNYKKPVEISVKEIEAVRPQFELDGEHLTRQQVVERYLRYNRRKFGVFDNNGKFLHMLGDDE